MNAKLFAPDGSEKGTTALPDELFGQQVNEHLLWLSVKRHLGNQRQGTAAVKTRGDVSGMEVGQSLNVSIFEKGKSVDVQGVTKGRGFAGVIKRHGFVAGHASHGPTMGREPGSIGSSAYPSRVIKGKRLPGRMGGKQLTIKHLRVVGVDADQNLLLVRGAVPGPVNGLVIVKKRED